MEPEEVVTRAEFRSIADRVEITELLSRYHHAIDARDWDALGAVFTEDAVADYLGLVVEGRDAIVTWLSAALGDRELTHFMANHVFELDGDLASSRSYLQDLDLKTGLAFGAGTYEGEHVRTPAGWRIRRLRLQERLVPDNRLAEVYSYGEAATRAIE
jgi:hypothetical protein